MDAWTHPARPPRWLAFSAVGLMVLVSVLTVSPTARAQSATAATTPRSPTSASAQKTPTSAPSASKDSGGDSVATIVVAAIGILVSGLVGPAFTASKTRKADEKRFERERAGARRDDLRGLFDEAAGLLAVGVTNIRSVQSAKDSDEEMPSEIAAWNTRVFSMQQRLRLRVRSDDPVIAAYDTAREALVALPAADNQETAVTQYEQDRGAFLDRARETLTAPITAGS